MTVRSLWSGFDRLPVAGVVAIAALYAAATVLAQFFARAPAWRLDSPLLFNSGLAVLFGLGWAAYCGIARGAAERRRWLAAAVAMLLLAAVQTTDTAWASALGLDDDWLPDLPLWIGAMALLRIALRHAGTTAWALRAWRTGVAVQVVYLVCDHGLSHATPGAASGADAMAAALVEGLELLTIECYVVAIVLGGGATAWTPAPTLDSRARRLYSATHSFGSTRLRLATLASWPRLLLSCLWLVATAGPRARRAGGRPIAAQFADLLALGFGAGFEPADYYRHRLHRPGGRAEAACFLSCGAAAGGVFDALARMRPQPLGGRELQDALLFSTCCRRNGLPVPPLLLVCDAGGIAWQAPRDALDGDLRCVPRTSGSDAMHLRRVGRERYRAPDGSSWNLDRLLERWARRGRSSPLIVQALAGDPASDAAPATVRVLTCLDACDRPQATHGMLLPAQGGGDAEAIELGTGCLDDGRTLAAWQACRALAIAAHRAFPDCIAVEWSIAIAADGPVLLGGSSHPDLLHVQRAHGRGIARSPLGPLLQHHLDALARAHGLADLSRSPEPGRRAGVSGCGT